MNDKDTSYDLTLSISQNTLRHDAYVDALAETPVTFYRDELMEVDASSIIPSLNAGSDYVSLYFDTSFARVLGLRFQYENAEVGNLRDDLDQEIVDRMAADDTLQSQMDAEVSAREAGDTSLGDAIDAEETARIAGDVALQGNIDAEEVARMAADTALQGGIGNEETARIAADSDLESRIDAEAAAREAGDIGEAQGRAAADSALANAIADEADLRLGGDSSLQTALNVEIGDRTAGDVALESQIAEACPFPKTYYLTYGSGPGNDVLGQCADGYHVANLREFDRLHLMEYAEGMGWEQHTANHRPGWINHPNGVNDCHDWTSDDIDDDGYLFNMTNEIFELTVITDQNEPLTGYGDRVRIFVGKQTCNTYLPVWCISD